MMESHKQMLGLTRNRTHDAEFSGSNRAAFAVFTLSSGTASTNLMNMREKLIFVLRQNFANMLAIKWMHSEPEGNKRWSVVSMYK